MKCPEFELGKKVKLVRGHGFIPTPSYPVVGSQYECEGEIISQSDNNKRITVNWDNGRRLTANTVCFLITEAVPYKSIW